MVFVLIFIFIINILLWWSIYLNLKDYKWIANIQSPGGLEKLYKINYDYLELKRQRPKIFKRYGNYQDSDFLDIPLDAPVLKKRNFLVFTSESDQLRCYGYKNGERHFVHSIYFNQATLAELSSIVESYNREHNKSDASSRN